MVFEDYLKQEISNGDKGLNMTNDKHIPGVDGFGEVHPQIVEQKNSSYRFDGNNVNGDVEMANLAKNTIMHEALVKQITDEYQKVKDAIVEGGK